MRQIFVSLSVLFIALSGMVVYVAFAQDSVDVLYPVSELGSCANEEECKAYCDNPEHMEACVVFAEQHQLMSEEEAQKAKAFLRAGQQGPGSCKNQIECEEYCSDVSRIEECLEFAEGTGIMTSEELAEARKILEVLKSGAQLPGGCKNKQECEAYCEDTSHLKECIEFAEQAGFMSYQELQEAKQILKAFDAGVQMPGNCRGKQECEAYCADQSHMEECFTFAVAAGFIPPEEAEQARKMMSLMAQGGMPGNCRSKEQCEAYCSDESHAEECANAFVAAGFMSEEESKMFVKTGGKGPGGCKGKDECDSFCNDPMNQEICFQFGKEHGLISQEDLTNMEEGMKQATQGLESAPPEVTSCLQERVGTEVLEKVRSGQFTPNPQLGEAMRSCFEKNMPQGIPAEMQEEGVMPGDREEFRGPGGCASQEECQEYCQAHPEQCGMPSFREGEIPSQNFQPPMFQEEGIVPEESQGSERLMPPSDAPDPYDERYRKEYEQQYQEQYQQRYEEQYQQQYPSSEGIQNKEVPQEPPSGGSILDAVLYFFQKTSSTYFLRSITP